MTTQPGTKKRIGQTRRTEVSGTAQALQTVLDLKGTAALSTFSSHQRRLLELSSNVMHSLT